MVREDRQRACCLASASRGPQRQRGAAIPVAVIALAAVLSASLLPGLLVSWGQEPPRTAPGSTPGESPYQFRGGERLFSGWPKPEVAIMISGQMNGYLQPCGCSPIQLGGLARRYNFLQSLKRDRGWNVVSADVGDIPQPSGPEAVLKYKYAMQALKKMGYTAVSFGKNELNLGLISTVGEFALNDHEPRVVAANLQLQLDYKDMVGTGAVSGGNGPTVGFIGFVDRRLMDFDDQSVKLEDNVNAAVQTAQQAFKTKPDLLVLLFQGKVDDAKKIASSKHFSFDVIVVPIEEEDPSIQPIKIGKTLIVSAGQKGRHVVVVGAFRPDKANQPYELRFQLVEIGPQYETPKGQDASNPIHALLQEYAQKVKNNNLLAEFVKNPSKHPVQIQLAQLNLPKSTFVGSEKCMKCHDSAYAVWSKSGHAHAYATLETKAVRPTLRQFDGECVRCHVTGFGYESGFASATATPNLKNVGCEACHGPASEHIKQPNNVAIHKIINPWKNNPAVAKVLANQGPKAALEKKMTLISDSCVICHDTDNSVNFKVEEYWKKVEHPTPQ